MHRYCIFIIMYAQAIAIKYRIFAPDILSVDWKEY